MKVVFISTILGVSLAANTWINHPSNGKDYIFVSDCLYGQENAEEACVALGGTLAIANSASIRSFIVNNVYDSTSSSTSCAGWLGFWTDGTLDDATDTITFSDGTTDSFSNVDWDDAWSEPNHVSSQPCFGFRGSTKEWHSVVCTESNAYFCERTATTTTTTPSPTRYTGILAGEDICFTAPGHHTGYEFNPPMDGEIYGIRLEHQSGSVTCKPSSAPTNFGCANTILNGDILGVQMVEVGGSTYYPTDVTDGVTDYYPTDSCPNECDVEWYKMSNYGPNDDTILLVDGDNTYQVTTSQEFSLQYGEGCCDSSTSDNLGESCADVYFLYNTTDCPTDTDFIYVQRALSYDDARKYCKSVYGTTLATISNDEEREAAIELIGDETVWFGLYSRSTGGKWRFLNGDECTDEDSVFKCIDFWKYRLNDDTDYRPRCIGPSEGGYQCGNFDGSEDIVDNDIDCEEELPFLCNSCFCPYQLNVCLTYDWPGSDYYYCDGNELVQDNYSCSDDCGDTTNGEPGCQDYENRKISLECCP